MKMKAAGPGVALAFKAGGEGRASIWTCSVTGQPRSLHVIGALVSFSSSFF